ncbi:hypothetical protein ACFLUD_02775 [Chloroflexota bacterium]
MATPWYYDYYEKGAFSHQQQLCDAVRWSKYNLEGQKLKSPTVLSAINANPLTIRLLALDEALKHFNNAKTIDKKIKELAREQFDKNKFFLMGGTWNAESSSLNTRGAPIEIIEIAGERLEFKHIDIHLALYEFFTNFGSVVDRLAYEIDKFYELNISRYYLDWGKLTSKPELDKLSRKNEVLAKLLSEYRNKFYNATRYRNRLTHDGIIHFEVECRHTGVFIGLGENPDDESAFNVDAIRFCEDKKEEVLTLLDESYKLMLQDYENSKEVS